VRGPPRSTISKYIGCFLWSPIGRHVVTSLVHIVIVVVGIWGHVVTSLVVVMGIWGIMA
jgi:hypothetical protein